MFSSGIQWVNGVITKFMTCIKSVGDCCCTVPKREQEPETIVIYDDDSDNVELIGANVKEDPLEGKAYYDDIRNEESIYRCLTSRNWLEGDDIERILKIKFELDASKFCFQLPPNSTSFRISIDKNLLAQELQIFRERCKINQRLCIALNIGNYHWVTLVLVPNKDNPEEVHVLYKDSMGRGMPSNVLEKIQQVYAYPQVRCDKTIEQQDSHTCGIHTILNIVYFSKLPYDKLMKICKDGFRNLSSARGRVQRVAPQFGIGASRSIISVQQVLNSFSALAGQSQGPYL